MIIRRIIRNKSIAVGGLGVFVHNAYNWWHCRVYQEEKGRIGLEPVDKMRQNKNKNTSNTTTTIAN